MLYRCEECGAVGQDGDVFSEITEQDLHDAVSSGQIDNPEDYAAAMEDVGRLSCTQCASTMVESIELDMGD